MPEMGVVLWECGCGNSTDRGIKVIVGVREPFFLWKVRPALPAAPSREDQQGWATEEALQLSHKETRQNLGFAFQI
jgi:hypothetical protein